MRTKPARHLVRVATATASPDLLSLSTEIRNAGTSSACAINLFPVAVVFDVARRLGRIAQRFATVSSSENLAKRITVLGPTEGWLPGRAVGDLVGIQLLEGRRFKLRSTATDREAVAVATTSLAPGGGIISTIYVIDGARLISVTARTENERDKVAFLGSLKLLQ